jgi:hypothetical protein
MPGNSQQAIAVPHIATAPPAPPLGFDGGEAEGRAVRGGAGMRATMPLSAALIDELRDALGREWVDQLLRATKRGAAKVYLAELSTDGQLLEWGRPPSGQRARLVGGRCVIDARTGRMGGGVPPCGSLQPGCTAGNSTPDSALAAGPGNGERVGERVGGYRARPVNAGGARWRSS